MCHHHITDVRYVYLTCLFPCCLNKNGPKPEPGIRILGTAQAKARFRNVEKKRKICRGVIER